MRLLVLGAEGPTGRLVAEGAVRRGHDVTALVRAPEDLGDRGAFLRTLVGDPLDGGVVSDAVDGAQAVIVTLADMRGNTALAARATLNAVRSMQRYGVRRLIVLSSASVAAQGQPGHPGFFARLLDPSARGGAIAGLRRTEVTVRQSELDWTLVRAGRLHDGPATGSVRAGPGYALPGARPLGRADLAAYLLDELERTDNLHHAVAVAG